jgi:hypothetical protein
MLMFSAVIVLAAWFTSTSWRRSQVFAPFTLIFPGAVISPLMFHL